MGTAKVTQIMPVSRMGSELITPLAWSAELGTFDAWSRASGLPASTRRLRNYHLRRFAVTTGVAPYDVTFDMIVDHLANPGWAPNTKASVRSSLRSFYRWATVSERIGRNPAESVPVVRTPQGRPRPAPEAAWRGAMHIADARVALMVLIGATAGLRAHEIAKVHSRDVVKEVVIKKGKRRTLWSLRVKGKGGKHRKVPIGKALAHDLRAHDGWVFPGQIEGHISAGYVTKLVSRALPAGVTAHMLRHRFASVAYSAGKDIRAVQILLGHSSLATTQIYTEVPDDDLRLAAAAAAA